MIFLELYIFYFIKKRNNIEKNIYELMNSNCNSRFTQVKNRGLTMGLINVCEGTS